MTVQRRQVDDDDVVVLLQRHHRLVALVDVDELRLRIVRRIEREQSGRRLTHPSAGGPASLMTARNPQPRRLRQHAERAAAATQSSSSLRCRRASADAQVLVALVLDRDRAIRSSGLIFTESGWPPRSMARRRWRGWSMSTTSSLPLVLVADSLVSTRPARTGSEHVDRGRAVVDVVVRVGVEGDGAERLRIGGVGDVDEADRASDAVRVDQRLAVRRGCDDLRHGLVGGVGAVVQIVGERPDALETPVALAVRQHPIGCRCGHDAGAEHEECGSVHCDGCSVGCERTGHSSGATSQRRCVGVTFLRHAARYRWSRWFRCPCSTSPIVKGHGRRSLPELARPGAARRTLGVPRSGWPSTTTCRGSPAPPPRCSSATSPPAPRIRVGAGGIMLPNHAPLVVAEQSARWRRSIPGRIDLGLGARRAPIRGRGPCGADSRRRRFPEDVGVLAYLPAAARRARPRGTGRRTRVPVWILGSSTFGAQLAAALGLPFAFASHSRPRCSFVATAHLPQRFRRRRVRRAVGDARRQRRRRGHRRGGAGPRPRRAARRLPACARPARPAPAAVAGVNAAIRPNPGPLQRTACRSSAARRRWRRGGSASFIERTSADELIVAAHIFDYAARLRSYELAATGRRVGRAGRRVNRRAGLQVCLAAGTAAGLKTRPTNQRPTVASKCPAAFIMPAPPGPGCVPPGGGRYAPSSSGAARCARRRPASRRSRRT